MASVDTVVFNIMNINKYPFMIHILNRKKAFGFTKDTAYMPDHKHYTPVEIIMATKIDGKQSRKAKIAYITYMPSWSTKITCLIDFDHNYATFQVSLPKFRYGHNVKMLYDQMPTPRPADCINNGYNSFKSALGDLINTILECGAGAIPWHDIVIQRIDICMNHLCLNQDAAMRKINTFKYNKKAYQRVSTPILNTYDSEQFSDMASTVFIKSKSHSFKIYHKGEEFFKHDYKTLYKTNPENANRLLNIAMRTVRFEASFRNTSMNYLYHRATVPRFIKYFFDNRLDTNFVKIISENLWEVLPTGLTVHQTILNTGLKIDPWNQNTSFKKIAEGIKKILGRRFDFYMHGANNFNSFHIIENQAQFDLFEYTILGNRFQKFVDEMTIDTEKLPDDAPKNLHRFKFMCTKFTDYELLNQGHYTAKSIYSLRSQLKRAVKKGTLLNPSGAVDQGDFNMLWDYSGGDRGFIYNPLAQNWDDPYNLKKNKPDNPK